MENIKLGQKVLIRRYRSEEYWLIFIDVYFLNENIQFFNMFIVFNKGED